MHTYARQYAHTHRDSAQRTLTHIQAKACGPSQGICPNTVSPIILFCDCAATYCVSTRRIRVGTHRQKFSRTTHTLSDHTIILSHFFRLHQPVFVSPLPSNWRNDRKRIRCCSLLARRERIALPIVSVLLFCLLKEKKNIKTTQTHTSNYYRRHSAVSRSSKQKSHLCMLPAPHVASNTYTRTQIRYIYM